MQTSPKGPADHGFTILPTTRLGRVAVGLFSLHGLLLIFFFILVALGMRGGEESFFSGMWWFNPIVLAAVAAIAGGLLALFAVLRRGENSLLVSATMLWAAFVVAFAAGEFLFPH